MRSMSRNRWAVLGIVAALACVPVIASVSSASTSASTAASKKKVNLMYLVEDLANPYMQSRIKGIKDAAREEGNTTVKVQASLFDPQKQVAQCQDALAAGKYQAIIVTPIVGTTLRSCAAQAKAKGVKIVAIDGPIGADYDSLKPQFPGVTGSSLQPASVVTKVQSKDVVTACKGIDPCQVARITGAPGYGADPIWTRVFNAGIKGHSNIKVVAAQPGNFQEAEGQKVMQNMLQAHPDINVLVTVADQVAMGAEKAIASAGRTGKIKIISAGASAESVTNICAGRWISSVNKAPRSMGQWAARIAIRSARGEKVQTQVDAVTKTGQLSVNKSNCKTFKAQYKIN